MTVREVLIKYGFIVDKKSKEQVEDTADNLLDGLSKIAKIMAKLAIIKTMVNIMDTYNQIGNEVAFVTRNLEDQAKAEETIADAAKDSRTSYASMVDTVKVLVASNSALFKTTKDAAEYAELMTKAFKGTGMESEKAAAMSRTLAQSFVTGKVSAGAISQMMTEAPQLLEYLADEMGVTTQAVKAIGMAGQITARQMYEALTRHAGDIEENFGNLTLTIKEAAAVARDDFGRAVTGLSNELKLTSAVSGTIQKVFQVINAVIVSVTEKVREMKKLIGDFPELGLGELADSLQSVLVPLMRIVATIGSVLAMPVGGFIKTLISLLNIVFKILEPILWVLEKIIDAIGFVVDSVSDAFFGDTKVVQDVTKKINVEASTAAAQNALVGSAANNTTNITNNFTNTFNGTDREIQQEQARAAESNADEIIRRTTTALAYGR